VFLISPVCASITILEALLQSLDNVFLINPEGCSMEILAALLWFV
jgi:hypothetical protein